MNSKEKTPDSSRTLGRIDEAIIDILRHNGRITYQELATLVHLTASPCQQRVRKLERLGVIRGYGAFIDVQKISPGLSLQVLVAISSQNRRTAQKAFEACVDSCPQVLECRLIGDPFDYSLRMHCKDMKHYRALTEVWLANEELYIDKLVAYPELAVVKHSSTHCD
jgi:DNA-binding Lrp family transcriptional regulator